MKRLFILCTAITLVGCAHYDRGGTATSTDAYHGSGRSYDRQANDMDDLGYDVDPYDNQKPNGQPRVP